MARAVFDGTFATREAAITQAAHQIANEARVIEARLAQSDWILGECVSAVDFVVYPGSALLLRAVQRNELRAPVGSGIGTAVCVTSASIS
ncbi:MAG: hypothetical protein HC872_00770 [Gammaproteobacteria bacterium]|nr:hypothetical protein [Gammaproteobacteria bacterium]